MISFEKLNSTRPLLIFALLLFSFYFSNASSINQIEAADLIQENYLYAGEDAVILNAVSIGLEEDSYWVGEIQKSGRKSAYVLVDDSSSNVLDDSEKISNVLETAFVFSQIGDLRQQGAFFTHTNARIMYNLANDIEIKTFNLKQLASLEVDSEIKTTVNNLLSSFKLIKQQALLAESSITNASETESYFFNNPSFESKKNLYEKYNLAFDEIFLLMDKIEEYELMLVQANDVIFNSELSFEDQGFFRQAIFSTSMLVDARQFNSLAVNFNESSKERFSMSKTEALTYADLSIQRINELAEIKELEDKVNKKAKDLESEVKNVINNSSEYKDIEGINELFDTWLLSIDNISKKEFETADQNLDKVSDLIKQVKNNGKKPAESFFQWEVIFGLAL